MNKSVDGSIGGIKGMEGVNKRAEGGNMLKSPPEEAAMLLHYSCNTLHTIATQQMGLPQKKSQCSLVKENSAYLTPPPLPNQPSHLSSLLWQVSTGEGVFSAG